MHIKGIGNLKIEKTNYLPERSGVIGGNQRLNGLVDWLSCGWDGPILGGTKLAFTNGFLNANRPWPLLGQ